MVILLLFLILFQLFAPHSEGTHFPPCLLRVDSGAQQRPRAMPHLGLGTQGEEKVIQAHFAFSADRQVLVLMMEENK